MHLHEAIRDVLIWRGGDMTMTIQEIADTINQRDYLYASKTDPREIALKAVSNAMKGTSPMFDVLIRLKGQ
jgi:hypothetical protein